MRSITISKRVSGKSAILIERIITFLLVVCLSITAEGQKKNSVPIKTVVIDAGHGGRDPGTIVGIAKEKNVVLDIALKLGRLIRQNQTNIKVVFTRDGDYYIPLMDRAQIANKINATLFISIHANYCKSPEVNGTETYVLGLHRTEDNLNVAKKENSVILLEEDYTTRYEGFNPNLSESYIMFELMQDTYLDQSLRFASILQSNFKELAQRHDREVRQAGFLVLRETSMPSVLIETGYLSNKKENTFLLSDAGRTEIARSIYGSLMDYLNKMDAKDNIANQTTNKEAQKVNDTTQKAKVTKRTKPQPEFVSDKDNIAEKEAVPSKPVMLSVEKDRKNTMDTSLQNKNKDKDRTTYAIQVGVFSRKINMQSNTFRGMSPVKELVKDGKYKYFCFESDTLEVTKANLSSAAKVFPGAFIVSINKGQVRMVMDSTGK